MAEIQERVAAERAAATMRRRFAAEPNPVAAGVVGAGVVQFEGQFYDALGGLGGEGEVVAVANVGRPGAAVYGAVSGARAAAAVGVGAPVAAGSSGGSGMAAHALYGPYHTGLLNSAQAPQFPLLEGGRVYTGDLVFDGGVTVDGMDPDAHIADVDAHHAKLHDLLDGTVHSVTGSEGTLVGLVDADTLGLLIPRSNAYGQTTVLKADGGWTTFSGIELDQLNAVSGTLLLGASVVEVDGSLDVTADGGSVTFAPTVKVVLNPGQYVEIGAGKYVRSASYTSGFAGAGFAVGADPNDAGHTMAEVDNLWVRGRMHAYEMLIHQIRATNGSIFVSSTGKAKSVTYISGADWTIVTDPEHGFAVGDLIRAQRWVSTGAGTTVYRCDMRVKTITDSKTFVATYQTGDSPAAGMEFVRLGSDTDATRRGGVYLTADDSGAPFIDLFDGVDSFAKWNTAGVIKGRYGKLSGLGVGSPGEYGLFVGTGQGTADTWIKAGTAGVTQNNVASAWYADGAKVIGIDSASGVQFAMGADHFFYEARRGVSWYDGSTRVGTLITSGTGLNAADRVMQMRVVAPSAGERGRLWLQASGQAGSTVELWAAGEASPGVFVELENTDRNNPYIKFYFEDEGGISAFNNLLLNNSGLSTAKGFSAASGAFVGTVTTPSVRASGAAGLRLEDDAGGLGVFVEDGGQVGIGTNVPAAALHVKGAAAVLRMAGAAANETLGLEFWDNDATRKGRLVYAGGNSAGNRYFGFINEGADDLRMFSDLHQWWSSSVELARLASTGLFTLRYGKLDVGGAGVGNSDAYVSVGVNRGSGASGNAILDLFGTNDATYNARLVRRGGANGSLELVNNGTGETLLNATAAGGTVGLYASGRRRLRMPAGISLPITTDYTLPEAYAGIVIIANRTTGGYGIYGVNPGNNAATPIVKIAENGFDWTANTAGTIRFYRSAANPAAFNLKNNIASGGPHELLITWTGAC